MGRRGGEPQPDRSAAGPGEADLFAAAYLPQDTLRNDAAIARVGVEEHRSGVGMVACRTGEARQADRSPARVSAHHVRSGDDPPDWLLPWNRELFAAFF